MSLFLPFFSLCSSVSLNIVQRLVSCLFLLSAFFIGSLFILFFWTSSVFSSSIIFIWFPQPFHSFSEFFLHFGLLAFVQSAWSHCMQRKNQSHVISSSRERQKSGSPTSFPVFLCLWTLDKITLHLCVPNWLWDQSQQVNSQPPRQNCQDKCSTSITDT